MDPRHFLEKLLEHVFYQVIGEQFVWPLIDYLTLMVRSLPLLLGLGTFGTLILAQAFRLWLKLRAGDLQERISPREFEFWSKCLPGLASTFLIQRVNRDAFDVAAWSIVELPEPVPIYLAKSAFFQQHLERRAREAVPMVAHARCRATATAMLS